MSSTLKIKFVNQSLEVSFDVGNCAVDVCSSLCLKDYPIAPDNFKVARDNQPVDKWIPLDPLGQYTFSPADPVQTSTPKKPAAEVTREEDPVQTSTPVTAEEEEVIVPTPEVSVPSTPITAEVTPTPVSAPSTPITAEVTPTPVSAPTSSVSSGKCLTQTTYCCS